MNKIKPIQNEKTILLKDKHNQYCFRVVSELDKPSIAKIISEQFGVTVLAVNTSVRLKKEKRTVKPKLYKRTYKYAIVSVQQGQSISFE